LKQLTLIKKYKLKFTETPEPKLQNPHDAILRPLVAGRCYGDALFLYHHYTEMIRLGVAVHYLDPLVTGVFGDKPFQPPFAIGHECVAEVVETGEEIKKIKKGDRVIVPWSVSCGDCATCNQKLYSSCVSPFKKKIVEGFGFGPGMGEWGGMISDLIRVPFADHQLFKVPAGMDLLKAVSLSDNVTDAYRTVAPFLESDERSPVLVVGGAAKSIGLYAAGIAVAMGSSQVDYADDDNERLDIASKLGANPIRINKKGKPEGSAFLKGGYPVTVDASNNYDRLIFALTSISHGGTCTSAGFYFNKGTKLPLWDMYVKNTNFKISVAHPQRDIPKALELISSGKFDAEKVTTVVADWEDAEEAYLEKTTKLVLKRKGV
jgi:threonine dehydrogenase-like Zn-dependent dehydrogenase